MEQNDILKDISIDSYKFNKHINYSYETIIKETKKKKNKFINLIIYLLKYSFTSTFIFIFLLLTTNYNAYFNIAKSYFLKDDLKVEEEQILNSVNTSVLKNNTIKKIKNIEYRKNQNFSLKTSDFKTEEKEISNIAKYKRKLDEKEANLNIEITPYENRVIIPKIARNIPLVDIKNKNIETKKELENIFMKELEKGIIRYPGSALPGEKGNSFIFGHSSNFPWMKGNYNEVFSTLNNLSFGDEIIVYYNQQKFVYKVREKHVINPKDVSILKRNKNKSEVSIMTCWPIGTTAKRLIVIGELIKK